jgi:hypothetical protein
MSAKNVVEEIRERVTARADTVYCGSRTYDKIYQSLSAPSLRVNAGDIRIAGADVEPVLDSSEMIIVCQKGDVFPTAKKFKNDR